MQHGGIVNYSRPALPRCFGSAALFRADYKLRAIHAARFVENLSRRGSSASGEKEYRCRFVTYRGVVNRLINFRRASIASGI